MDSELRKCPARNKRPRDSNDEIANEAQAGALDDLAGNFAQRQWRITDRFVGLAGRAGNWPGGPQEIPP